MYIKKEYNKSEARGYSFVSFKDALLVPWNHRERAGIIQSAAIYTLKFWVLFQVSRQGKWLKLFQYWCKMANYGSGQSNLFSENFWDSRRFTSTNYCLFRLIYTNK
jgi:hypothetical protein